MHLPGGKARPALKADNRSYLWAAYLENEGLFDVSPSLVSEWVATGIALYFTSYLYMPQIQNFQTMLNERLRGRKYIVIDGWTRLSFKPRSYFLEYALYY
jgi:hypothetical protein